MIKAENLMNESRRPLDPISRVSEIVFGLIMALTFTGSLSAAAAGQEEIRTMLLGAIGCNIAWGLIDAVMYLLTRLIERGRHLRLLRAVRSATVPEDAHRLIAEHLPPRIVATQPAAELEAMRVRLAGLPEPPKYPALDERDYLGAVGVFLLVVLSTFPVVVPFLFVKQAMFALRISNGIAVIMLFMCGYRLALYSGNRPFLMGSTMAVIGSVLVGLTIALGG